MLIERLSGDEADESRLSTVGKWQVAGQLIQMWTTHWAVRILVVLTILVALTEYIVKEVKLLYVEL